MWTSDTESIDPAPRAMSRDMTPELTRSKRYKQSPLADMSMRMRRGISMREEMRDGECGKIYPKRRASQKSKFDKIIFMSK
jgi:hypothetical protein